MMKRFLQVLSLLLCAVLLFSCTEPTPPDEGNNTPNGGNETVKPDPILTPASEPFNVNGFAYCESENGMPYRLYYPENYSEDYAYPVVMFLHGAGERGTDNEATLIHVLQDWFNDLESPIYQSIVIVPQCPEGEQWVNTPWENGSYDSVAVGESDAIKEALSILELICTTDSVNMNRIYVSGISMGGYGTWNLLMNHSDLFAAGMPICGAADPARAEVLKDMPVYAFHGDRDSVVPVAGTRDMVNAIIAKGGTKAIYHEVLNTDHNSWSYAASRGDALRWIFLQRRTDK